MLCANAQVQKLPDAEDLSAIAGAQSLDRREEWFTREYIISKDVYIYIIKYPYRHFFLTML